MRQTDSKQSFFGRLLAFIPLRKKTTAPSVAGDTPAESDAISKSPVASASASSIEIRRFAFIKWFVRFNNLALANSIICAAILLVAGLSAGSRQTLELRAPPSLRKAMEDYFSLNNTISLDDLALYVNLVLPAMHQLDQNGAANLPLVRGMISSGAYSQVLDESHGNLDAIKANQIVQTLIITGIQDVIVDKEARRISAYCCGFLTITIQKSGRHVTLPYRADILLEETIPSRTNRFPFTFISKKWMVGDDALNWDNARKIGAQNTD
jgi:hypothetical protein